MKTAIVWRKSCYDTHTCTKCGTWLFGPGNEPVNVYQTPRNGRMFLICKKCNDPVAFLEPYEGEGENGELKGHWEGET